MIDSARVVVIAGKGGNGAVSFRREKYVPRGGPDGGDGGDGGNIIIQGDKGGRTLTTYTRQKTFEAEDGQAGSKQKRHGKSGQDLILKVPIGTMISEVDASGKTKFVADILSHGQELRIARGGHGGKGNVNFATSTNQAPRQATSGTYGDKKELAMELRLLADVGIIGLPNVGKSTLISLITQAKPKIGDYAFTTIEPNLGVMNYKGRDLVIADIPGLIEGASKGKGLGDQFLKHVERTSVLVHLVSADSLDLEENYQTVRHELKDFDPKLLQKPEIVVVSRFDLVTQPSDTTDFISKHKALTISLQDNPSIEQLEDEIIERVFALDKD